MTRESHESKLYMVGPIPSHNHYGLKLWGPNELIDRFNEICSREFSPRYITEPEKVEERRAWGAFWQSQAEDFLYIEFWMPPTEATKAKVWSKAQEIAQELGLPLIEK